MTFRGADFSGYDDSKYGIPVVEEGTTSLTPTRHSISARAGAQNLGGWVQSYRATLGVRSYEHSELEGAAIGTTFHNDTIEGEVLVSHKRVGMLVGSFGGWFLNRAFDAVGAEALSPPVDRQAVAAFTLIPPGLPQLGIRVTTRVDEAVEGADVIVMPRIQLERMEGGYFPSLREYFTTFGMTEARVARAKPDVIIMHPGPINRGVEIASEVADGAHSVILDQVANGVAVRMAVLYLLAGPRIDAD